MATFNNEERIILIDDFWNQKIIPAVLRNAECKSPGRSEVWIPEGYENGGGGFSTRLTNTIKEFNGTDEVKKDVLTKWADAKIRNNL